MRAWVIATVGALLFTSAGRNEAGVYCTFEKPAGPTPVEAGARAMPYDAFQLAMSQRTDLANPAKPDKRAPYLKRRDELQAKVDNRAATAEDFVNLSACYIYLGETQKAIELLEPVARNREQHQNNFMIFANLASAYQILGQLDRAFNYLQEVRDRFPAKGQAVAGLKTEEIDWYRESEKWQLRLLRLRLKEAGSVQPGQPPKAPDAVDALFEASFTGDNGLYEAGKLAAGEKSKLPSNALAIVQQLMLWLPEPSGLADVRLYWLYGELLNADGDVKNAKDVLSRCSWDRNFNPPQLRDHRQVLVEALAEQKPPPNSWLPDTSKLIAVGGGTAVVIAFLAFLQIREMRRRRQASLR
jgi:tetratricopeptide (TPR) repeat protein